MLSKWTRSPVVGTFVYIFGCVPVICPTVDCLRLYELLQTLISRDVRRQECIICNGFIA